MGLSSKSSKMRSFLVICAVIAVAVAKKGNGGKRDSGVCMEDDEVVAMCTFGTSIGSKLEAAATACENADQAAGRKRRPGKGNGKKCPTVEEIWNTIEGKMGDEFCVFQQIGWLDENYEFDNATNMAGDKKMKRCWNKYTEEEQTMLEGIGQLTAGISCFLDSFMDACSNHVKTELMSLMMPAGK